LADWEAYEAAKQKLIPNLTLSSPAQRYGEREHALSARPRDNGTRKGQLMFAMDALLRFSRVLTYWFLGGKTENQAPDYDLQSRIAEPLFRECQTRNLLPDDH